MSNATTVSALVEAIYDAAIEPTGWEAVVTRLEQALKGPAAILVHADRPIEAIAAASACDERLARDYLDHYWTGDRAASHLRRAPVGEIVVDSALVSDRERERIDFYRDYLGAVEGHRGIYASLRRDGEAVTLLGVHRSRRRGDYGSDEAALLRQLVPHFNRALRVHGQLRETALQQRASELALDHTGIGLILVDAEARPRFVNGLAEKRLVGRGLTVSGGRLHALTAAGTNALRAAIAAATERDGPVGRTVTLPPGAEGDSLRVMVTPVRPGGLDGLASRPLAMLVLGDDERPAIGDDRLREAYDLTAAEGRLLAALVRGERPAAYAERTGVKLTTVRTHLRGLFQKTGEQRQADLVRLALSDPLLRLKLEQ